jgi:hypothetical protein
MADIPDPTALFTGVVGDPIEGSSVDDKGPTNLLPPESGGGGDATVFRQNPEVTRSSP